MSHLRFAFLLGGLLALTPPALGQEARSTLLVPGANAYAASGGYALHLSGAATAFSADVFTPFRLSEHGADFIQARVSYGGSSTASWGRVSFGKVSRKVLSPRQIVGVNAYVDVGKKSTSDRIVGQVTLGGEYERLGLGPDADSLRFGANLYQPFRDYTDPAKGPAGNVPRHGLDAFVAWSRAVGEKLRFGARASLFFYPATTTRNSQGIGTLSLDGMTTRGLPPGASLTGRVTARYTPGEPLAPLLNVEFRQAFQKSARARPVGGLRPSRYCRVEAGEERLEQLVCQGVTKRRKARREDILDTGERAKGAFTVAPPERHLGYGTLYIP
ncbi:hypothetical protein [Pseudooceanicola sp. LIPI14-2-Ac024]|uniref:hypothetical protein n=1 Tax=Pseudooceanicola sp. LIPI14-2-Ac024 TaxID=3344875 RepID=UPI0035D0DA0D